TNPLGMTQARRIPYFGTDPTSSTSSGIFPTFQTRFFTGTHPVRRSPVSAPSSSWRRQDAIVAAMHASTAHGDDLRKERSAAQTLSPTRKTPLATVAAKIVNTNVVAISRPVA